jgi:ribosome-associated toxin RatA of RatAB toxin-antitoxin module
MAARTVEVRRSALVAHPAERLFSIIEAAEDYPAFLPWCGGATILERDEQVVAARIQIAWRGVRFSFVTRNPKRPPRWMSIGLEEGPFRRFDGQWNLTPLSEWGCRVEFALSYEMNSAILSALAGPVFDHAVNTLVDAFIARADQVAAGLARVSTDTASAQAPTPAPAPAAAPAIPPAPPPEATVAAEPATEVPAGAATSVPPEPSPPPAAEPGAGPPAGAPAATPDADMIENPDERKP